MTLEAVVLAAGEGRRLRPLTETWPKPLLPIDRRPVIATLLRELEFAGRVTVVTGHLEDKLRRFLAPWDVTFAHQPEVLGSADAVRRALDAGARPPILVTAADTLYVPGALARFAAVFEESGAAAGMAPPAWALKEEAVPFLDDLPGPPYELRTAFERMAESGLHVETIEIGPTRSITTPADLVRENFIYLED
ncbi:MAG TPA: NTP transferase domain-containing protein [Gaiellaceae bacterium]